MVKPISVNMNPANSVSQQNFGRDNQRSGPSTYQLVKSGARDIVTGGIVGAAWGIGGHVFSKTPWKLLTQNAWKGVGLQAASWAAAFLLIDMACKFTGRLFSDR